MFDSILDLFAFVGLLVLIPIGIPTLVVCVIDILWAGPAAFISAREAEKYGYDPGECAKRGALYSLLSFALWRSLMKVMHGEEFDTGDVRAGYIMLFVCWFVPAPFFSATLAMLAFGSPVDRFDLSFVWTAISFFVWFTSIRKLREFHRKRVSDSFQDSDDETTKAEGEITIPLGYIMPFLLAKLSILITVVIFLYDSWY